jgi:hypothetical protein
MLLSGLPRPRVLRNPVISSLSNTLSRQCPSAVPGPPVFSTGIDASCLEKTRLNSAVAPGPM